MSEELDDFVKADQDAGLTIIPKKEVFQQFNEGLDIVSVRKKLLEEYHNGSSNLLERLKAEGKNDLESVLMAMLEEVILEADHLLGNELVSTRNGDLRDASVIGFKRTEVFEKAMKALQTKLQFEKQSGIDVESPSMMIVFRFFMSKVKETFQKMKMEPEMESLFFQTISSVTMDWKKELRQQFEQLRKSRG